MKLSDEQIAVYQKLYKENYGIDLTKQEALGQALALINIVQISYFEAQKTANSP
jgi:hypothetical protein